ncbi:MAG: nucleoside triphosphate pyrophosphohydrolase [Planctomycetota bacterium]
MPPRPFEAPSPSGEPRLDALHQLLAVVDRLRAPDGCAWDREQTLTSFAPNLIEEAHEVVEAIERGGAAEQREELGDCLMACVLLARIAEDSGSFDLAGAANEAVAKLLRRHPHVFGDGQAGDADEVLRTWESIKAAERREQGADASAVAGVPVALPALQRAMRLGQKAMGVGFRWEDVGGAVAKLHEETAELEVEIERGDADRIAQELGDVLLASAFLGNYLGVDPEAACRAALARFESRFRHMEGELDGSGESLEEWMAAWGRAKAKESR